MFRAIDYFVYGWYVKNIVHPELERIAKVTSEEIHYALADKLN